MGHISSRNLAKKLKDTDFYIDIEIITEQFTREYAECFAKYYSRKIIKNPKIIIDQGPNYILLIDYTYLDTKYYGNKTK